MYRYRLEFSLLQCSTVVANHQNREKDHAAGNQNSRLPLRHGRKSLSTARKSIRRTSIVRNASAEKPHIRSSVRNIPVCLVQINPYRHPYGDRLPRYVLLTPFARRPSLFTHRAGRNHSPPLLEPFSPTRPVPPRSPPPSLPHTETSWMALR